MDRIQVIDGFYNNPDEVREFALSQKFDVFGNYPGARTGCLPNGEHHNMKRVFESILGEEISYWPDGYNSAFQYTTHKNKSWIHADNTDWACVVYLTPNAPLDAGTALFRNRDTGIMCRNEGDSVDYNTTNNHPNDWEAVLEVKNVYNRAVMYPGKYYHSSWKQAGWGTDQFNGRLFQTFFFDT